MLWEITKFWFLLEESPKNIVETTKKVENKKELLLKGLFIKLNDDFVIKR